MHWRLPTLALLLMPLSWVAADSGDVEWGYQGVTGPLHWSTLSPEFELCGRGRSQSPIDLRATEPVRRSRLDRLTDEEQLEISIETRARTMDLIDNGHTIQISSDVRAGLRLDGDVFSLVQFHFHAPSEHTLDGKHALLEVHFVMSNTQGDLAVIGELYESGAADPAFDPIIEALPAAKGEERHLDNLQLELGALKPLPERYYRYDGSLTTPPCSEGVRWIVLADMATLSAAQLEEIVSHLHGNARPAQPLNDRNLLLVTP